MKKIRFAHTFYATGENGISAPLFEAGKDYPADHPEAVRCVARGIAEEVEVPDPQPEPAAEAAPTEVRAEAPADPAAAEAEAKPAKAKK